MIYFFFKIIQDLLVIKTITRCLGKSLEEVIKKLEESSGTTFNWFENNGIKSNPDKYHMLVSKNGSLVANIDEIEVSYTKTEKLLGVTFDNRLTSNNFCKTVSNILLALARVASYMDQDKNTF